jgi:hypothetical protein
MTSRSPGISDFLLPSPFALGVEKDEKEKKKKEKKEEEKEGKSGC